MVIFLIYVVILSIITFVLYGVDKRRAIENKWRIKEKVLILFGILGGAVGGLLGMYFFHHKTKKEHWYFAFFNFIGIIIHIFVTYYIYSKIGFFL